MRNNNSLDFYPGECVRITQNEFIAHIVKPTETLLKIATTYKTTIEKLISDNDIKTEKLYIGQLIKIYK